MPNFCLNLISDIEIVENFKYFFFTLHVRDILCLYFLKLLDYFHVSKSKTTSQKGMWIASYQQLHINNIQISYIYFQMYHYNNEQLAIGFWLSL